MIFRKKLIVLMSILLNSQNVFGSSRLDPLVDTKVGLIRGVSSSDGNYSSFMGIPYAKFSENNPFGISTPYPKFETAFEAYDDSSKCPQFDFDSQSITGTLDCLHINVHVPRTANSHNKVPVMVYIHGGFFNVGFAGSYRYGPKYLVRHNVILVTFNYRLGPYGFMCLDTPEVPGNQGLRDQALAMNWVKNNIEAFGGNPNQITIFGESAGAHSVDFHLIYGDEKLFQNAILQSGSSLASTVFTEPDKSAAQKIAEHLGKTTTSITEALSFLANVDPTLVIDAVKQLNLTFKPCIEKEFDNVEPFIKETWVNVKKPKVKGKSMLLGFNEFERIRQYDNPKEYINKNVFSDYLKLTFDFDDENLVEMENLVRHFYLGDENISEDVRLDLAMYDSDYTYIHPMQKSIKLYLDNAAKNIYYYMFTYTGVQNSTTDGAAHGDELIYLFDQIYLENNVPEEHLKIDQMTKMWTNFAKYGNPTPEESELLPVKWIPLSKENYYYLNIGSELTIGKRPMHNRMAFWDLFYMLNEKSQKFYADIE